MAESDPFNYANHFIAEAVHESQAYERGFKDGCIDAEHNGFKFGIIHGWKVGHEIGMIRGLCFNILNNSNFLNSSSELTSIESSSKQQENLSSIRRHAEQLLELVNSFPLVNDRTHSVSQEVQRIRAKSKILTVMIKNTLGLKIDLDSFMKPEGYAVPDTVLVNETSTVPLQATGSLSF